MKQYFYKRRNTLLGQVQLSLKLTRIKGTVAISSSVTKGLSRKNSAIAVEVIHCLISCIKCEYGRQNRKNQRH